MDGFVYDGMKNEPPIILLTRLFNLFWKSFCTSRLATGKHLLNTQIIEKWLTTSIES